MAPPHLVKLLHFTAQHLPEALLRARGGVKAYVCVGVRVGEGETSESLEEPTWYLGDARVYTHGNPLALYALQ